MRKGGKLRAGLYWKHEVGSSSGLGRVTFMGACGAPVHLTTTRRVLRSAKNRLVLLALDKSLLSPCIAANKSRIRKLTDAYMLWKNTVTTCKIYSLQYCCRWGYKILLRGF